MALSTVLLLAVAGRSRGAEAPPPATPPPAAEAEAAPPAAATPPSFPRVDADLAALSARVEAKKAEFQEPAAPEDKEWVERRLQHLVDVDQTYRDGIKLPGQHEYSVAEREYFWSRFGPAMGDLDRPHTAELAELLARYRWFTIGEFDAKTDGNAWLLVQHADHDVEFQERVLAVLTELYPKGETNSRNYALLFDRVATNRGRPQRYGTQGRCTGPGTWEPNALEEPARIDELRALVGLGTLADYKARFKEICG